MVFVHLYQRTSQSYEVALGQYQQRVAAGLQPSTRVVDLFNVNTEEGLLISTNFCYLGLVILLYLRMLVGYLVAVPVRRSQHSRVLYVQGPLRRASRTCVLEYIWIVCVWCVLGPFIVILPLFVHYR